MKAFAGEMRENTRAPKGGGTTSRVSPSDVTFQAVSSLWPREPDVKMSHPMPQSFGASLIQRFVSRTARAENKKHRPQRAILAHGKRVLRRYHPSLPQCLLASSVHGFHPKNGCEPCCRRFCAWSAANHSLKIRVFSVLIEIHESRHSRCLSQQSGPRD
jgi:hypothetical protein